MNDLDSAKGVKRWWVSVEGKRSGPFTKEEIEIQLSSGKITQQSYACPTGQLDWKRISELFAGETVPASWQPPPPPDAFKSSNAPPTPRKESKNQGPIFDSSDIYARIENVDLDQVRTLLYDQTNAPRLWPWLAVTLAPYSLSWILPGLGSQPTGPWGLALFSCLIAAGLLWHYIRPEMEGIAWGIFASALTIIVSMPLLLLFQATSHAQAGEDVSFGTHPSKLIPYLVHQVQQAYLIALNPELESQTSFLGLLFYTFISVALCEELVKLAPLIILLAMVKDTPPRTIIWAGACSGFGFGIAESIFYHYNIYTPESSSLSLYLVRFITVPLLHASWAIISTAIYYLISRDWETPTDAGPYVVIVMMLPTLFAILPSMALHTFYNVLVPQSAFLALVPVLISVYLAYLVFRSADDPSRLAKLVSPSTDLAN